MRSEAPARPRVVYWNNIPAPYMIERFNAVADRGTLAFEAWFNERQGKDRSWKIEETSWRFRYRYVPATTVAGRTIQWPLPVLQRRLDVLVTLYAEPVFVVGWLLAKMRGARTAFWCVSTSDRWIRRSPLKDLIKRAVLPRSEAVLSPGDDGRSFAMRYGVPPEKAWVLRHAIDVQHFSSGRDRERPLRGQVRSELGVVGTTYLYVGRLWSGKGLDFLVTAFDITQRTSADEVSLLLVGDGPDGPRLEALCEARGIRNVRFAGFHDKERLPRFYAAADVFVFPTLGDPYGLVVDEAMASGLPIVATNAAGEIRDRVREGGNGFVVEPADSEALADAMLRLATDARLREEMGRASSERIQGRTPEQWAEDFENVVARMLRAPRR